MKKKIFTKKLNLNKTTVSQLNMQEMNKVNGGLPNTRLGYCQAETQPEKDLSEANGTRCWAETINCPI